MDWKTLLKSFLGFALPIAYGLIVTKLPDFPLAQDSFVTLIVYLVGFAFGGWQAQKLRAAK